MFGMAETNTDWRLVKEENKLHLWTKEWWDTLHFSHTHNTAAAPITAQQSGDTALLASLQWRTKWWKKALMVPDKVNGRGLDFEVNQIIHFGLLQHTALNLQMVL
jgi:hypothetical protein